MEQNNTITELFAAGEHETAEAVANMVCKDQEAAVAIMDHAIEVCKQNAPDYAEWNNLDKLTYLVRYAVEYGCASMYKTMKLFATSTEEKQKGEAG